MRADRVMAEGGKRIDLGAPLRSPLRLPYHKADLKSGPVCHPGAVPFVWEQSPGRPKSVRTRRPAPPSPAPSTPQPPRPSENGGEEGTGGATPYHDALGERDRTPPPNPAAAAVPQNGAAGRKIEGVEKEAKAREVLSVADVLRDQEEDVVGVGDEEERFSDALDTLSRTESFTVNCSVSGLSGVPDRPAGAAAVTVPGARGGFMMDRFLPAAQAVAVGSPQYTFRKAGATGSSAREHAHAAAANWRVGSDDDRARRTPVPLPYQHLPPNYLSCNYPRGEEHGGEEEEDDDDDVHSTRGFASKGCGLLPGLCVKTSLMLLNPMPTMKNSKVRGRGRDRGLPSKGRGQNAPSPLARSAQNKNLGCDSNGRYWEEVYKHKLERKYIHQGEDRRSKMTSESNHLTFWSDSQTGDGSSPFHNSVGDAVSPNRRDVALSPSPKASGSFGTRDRDESRSNGSSSVGIDHDHSSLVGSDRSSLKGSSSMSSGVDKTLHEDSMDHSAGIDSETSQLPLLLDPKTSLNSGYDVQLGGRPIVISNSIAEVKDSDLSTERTIEVPQPAVLMPSRNAGSVKLDNRKTSTRDTSQNVPLCLEEDAAFRKESSPLQYLLPLPVPKSPSDSWLSRNLPSVKNKPHAPSFLGIQVQPKKQAPWASAHPKENDLKPPRPRQIRFADVVERPNYLDTEV